MKKFKTSEGYISWVSQELESANHHNYVNLPEKLFNNIKNSNLLGGDEAYELELARIIAEEFYKNI